MGNSHNKKSNVTRNSNCSVYNFSLESKNQILEEFENISIDSDFDIKNDLKKKVNLKIENDKNEIEEEEIELSDNSGIINNNIFLEGNTSPKFHLLRSRTEVNNNFISFYNAPKQKMKVFDEYISPFNLSSKNYGGTQLKNKKPNEILLDFKKNKIDSKSCNDYQNNIDDFSDNFIINADTERTTPNIEDLQDLQLCRKKMAIFRDSIDNKSEHSLNENEKIEYIFSEKKNKKSHKYWIKYIKQQMNKSKLSSKLAVIDPNAFKKSETLRINNTKNNDLFILGILENAAKDKKLKKMDRYTSVV